MVRPRGKLPPVISSKPVMPVDVLFGTFAKSADGFHVVSCQERWMGRSASLREPVLMITVDGESCAMRDPGLCATALHDHNCPSNRPLIELVMSYFEGTI